MEACYRMSPFPFLKIHPLRAFIIFTLMVAAGSENLHAQTYAQQFDSYFLREQPDTLKIHTLLRLWNHMSPEDPQLYVAAFNFYLGQSVPGHAASSSRAGVDSGTIAVNGRILHPGDTGVDYNQQQLRTALNWINAGIRRDPDRLDMRFGKAHALRLTHQFDSFLVVMRQVLARSVENRSQWLWNNGESLDSGRQFVLRTMQTYMREFYEADRATLLPVMTQLGEAIIGVYPEEVEVLTTTGVGLLLQGRHDQAIAYLRRAENVRPDDVVVLNNLFEAYRMKGDKSSARRYIDLVEKHGGSSGKSMAKSMRKSLRRD